MLALRAAKSAAILAGVSLFALLPGIHDSYATTQPGLAHEIHESSATDTSNIFPYSPGSSNLALDIGQVFLMGNLGNQYSDAIGEQLHYTYGVSDLFGFDASAGYSNHSSGSFSMATALFGLRTNLSFYDKLVPYSIFGMGFYKPTYTSQLGTASQSTLSPILFGLHAGFGADLLVTNSVFFGAGLTLHDVFGGDQNTSDGGTISTGGTFISFLLHAGMSF